MKNGVVQAALEGTLKMKHSFYHKDDNSFVAAGLVGYLEFEPAKPRIRSFRLVTDNATYGGNSKQFFGVVVREVAGNK